MRESELNRLSGDVAEALTDALKKWLRLRDYLMTHASEGNHPKALLKDEAWLHFQALREAADFECEEMTAFATALADGWRVENYTVYDDEGIPF